jgi:2-oxoglutarate ferredoxin oxidoreductase subunit delta
VPVRSGTIEINQELCKGCLLCIRACPKDLIVVSSQLNAKGYFPVVFREKGMKRDKRQCTGCCLCAICCPDMAIEVFRE